MNDNLDISNYLTDVHTDWQDSRKEFPLNTYPPVHWPVPFFGNPRTAIVATVGVNPSSQEFDAGRQWPAVAQTNRGDWKTRLKCYFNQTIQADDWFDSWRVGLAQYHGTPYEHPLMGVERRRLS